MRVYEYRYWFSTHFRIWLQEFAEKCLACKPHTVKGKTVISKLVYFLNVEFHFLFQVDSKRAVPRELIGKVEAQNGVDEDVTYQNNRKVLLTGKICSFYSFYFSFFLLLIKKFSGLQKAHTVLALREYFTSFGLLNQVSSRILYKM